MNGGDAVFYALALAALVAALASAVGQDLRRAARSLRFVGLAVAGLLATTGAWLAASLLAALVLVGHVRLRRLQPADEGSGAASSGSGGRVRASMLVLAFFVIVARVVLMVRWPVLATAANVASPAVTQLPPIGLAHYLLAGLALLCVGLFAAITRRSGAGVGIGVALVQAAVAVVVAAAAHFTGSGDAGQLATAWITCCCIVAAAALRVGNRHGDYAHESAAAQGIATSISAVLAGVALALLAGAW